MAPLRSRLAVGAAGIVAGIALHGCDLSSHVQTVIETACSTSVTGIIDQGKANWLAQVEARCQQLEDQAKANGLSDEKAAELKQSCVDTTSVDVNEDADEQQENYTKACLERFSGLNDTANVYTDIHKYFTETDFSEVFKDKVQNLMGPELGNETKTLDELKELYPDAFAGIDTSGGDSSDTGGAADNEGGSDGTSGGEAPAPSGDGGEAPAPSGDGGKAPAPSSGHAGGASGGTGTSPAPASGASKPGASSPAPAPASGASKPPGRLFDDAVRLPHTNRSGYAVLSCLLGCALAAAVGLAVVLRRRKARASDHDRLMTAEESE